MRVDGAEDLDRLAKVDVACSREREERCARSRRAGGLERAKLGLVEIGLKPGFDDFEWCC